LGERVKRGEEKKKRKLKGRVNRVKGGQATTKTRLRSELRGGNESQLFKNLLEVRKKSHD